MAMQGMQGAQGQQGAQPQMQAGPTPRINIQEFENKLGAMPDSSLKQLAQNPNYMTNAMYGPLINAELTRRVAARQSKQMQQTPQGQQPTVVQQAQQAAQQLPEDTGIAQLPAQNIANMAGGGIVAFAVGGDMEDGEVEYDPSMDIQQEDEDVIALGGDEPDSENKGVYRAKAENALRYLGAGAMDVLTFPGRFAGKIVDEGIIRPLRAFNVPVPYIPESFYGGSRSGGLPYLSRALSEATPTEPTNLGELGYNTLADAKLQNPKTAPAAEQRPTSDKPAGGPSSSASAGPAGAAGPTGIARYLDAVRQGMGLVKDVKPDYSALTGYQEKQEGAAKDLTKEELDRHDKIVGQYRKFMEERGQYGKGREERLAKQEEGLTKRREEAQGMALFQAGMAILAAPPGRGAMAALGIGAQSGLKMYQSDVKELQAAADKIQAARDALEDIRYKEQSADAAQLRGYEAERNKIVSQGARELQKIADVYGFQIPKATADAAFQASLESTKIGVQAGVNLAKILGDVDETGMRVNRPSGGGKGGLGELERIRIDASKKWNDPIARAMAIVDAKSKGIELQSLNDYLRYQGIPVNPATEAGGSASSNQRVISWPGTK